MNYRDFFFAVLLHVFSQQPTMALFDRVFTAKETRAIKRLYTIFVQNISVFQQTRINFYIFLPSNLLLVPLVQQFFCWSKIGDVFVRNMTNFLDEKLQIFSLCEACQLATIANADIYQLFDIIIP